MLSSQKVSTSVFSIDDLATLVDYSLLENLQVDPDATQTGDDYMPRQVFSGHYVPVKPTAIPHPQYIAHSPHFFAELGFADSFALTDDFTRLFSGDLSTLPERMRPYGWATGYALSIYGTEYTQQCPFQTGNGYGDGRAISVVEAVINGQRWEMQLKGAGRTPYCRGADGRAVLRSSVREFLAQEHMHALGVPTTRSLSLFVSQSETADRPWYREDSTSYEPDIMVANPVAISTRVAPSFLRVGQLELFARRARKNEHPQALNELQTIVLHLIDREYSHEIDKQASTEEKVLQLATAFRERLASLVSHWMRVGFCQGNFNSDNCACGGFTLDYGPFGFCERFDPVFQPWTGGGRHFSFFNQAVAANANFDMFCKSLKPLLANNADAQTKLDSISQGFSTVMQDKLEQMWADKLGLLAYNSQILTNALQLMIETSVDYNAFFYELSKMPKDVEGLSASFYRPLNEELSQKWAQWLQAWQHQLNSDSDTDLALQKMRQSNPKFTWREWLIAPAYNKAINNDFALIHELQEVLTHPYQEQTKEIEDKYYSLRPQALFEKGGISHYSCSS